MNLKGFSESQCQALLDLAVLAMYADGHLAEVEDARMQQLLTAMGCDSDYDRNRDYDAAVSRISRHSQTAEEARAHAVTLAKGFTTRDQRQQAHEVINDLVKSDSKIAPQEGTYLALVRQAFQM